MLSELVSSPPLSNRKSHHVGVPMAQTGCQRAESEWKAKRRKTMPGNNNYRNTRIIFIFLVPLPAPPYHYYEQLRVSPHIPTTDAAAQSNHGSGGTDLRAGTI